MIIIGERERDLIIFKQLGPLLLIGWSDKVTFHVKWLRIKVNSFNKLKTFQLPRTKG